ncbi:MerR family transcriptional regulator [Methyloceanibacter methanicus]|uniref:MerR family transcriptional regulator n=1 Tax=Methyloceanibacter methanicus TaxID=1774968 RepID=UPI00114CD8D0|nr:MerR family transcriptional regulator [Methyloceanibacter methanicus]
MMLTEEDVVARVSRLTVTRLRVFVSQGLIKPRVAEPDEATPQGYSEADLARAALICNLEDELGFHEEDVPVLLSLIDQIHGLRSELRASSKPSRNCRWTCARPCGCASSSGAGASRCALPASLCSTCCW